MTKNNEHTNTNISAKGGPVTDLLEPRYTQKDRARLEDLRSRINVARAVLAARVGRGLTQGELGKAAGTKQSRVSEIEAMKGNPRFDTLDRVARPLGLMVTLVPRDGQALLPTGHHGKYEASTRYTATSSPRKMDNLAGEMVFGKHTAAASGVVYG